MKWRFEVYEALQSTSDFCKARAEDGESEGLAVLARRQTAGRGTRGRSWVDPGNNLSFSFVLRFSTDASPLPVLPFIVALAVHGAFAHLAGNCSSVLSLKWPNDLLLDDRKMAGILIEAGGSAHNQWIVVGVGANLVVAPQVPGRELAAFSEIATAPDPLLVAEKITEYFSLWLDRWKTDGFAEIRSAWLSRAHPLGRRLAVQSRETYITGMFSGLDEQGRLLLALESGEILPVITGDVLLD
ncbi:biotin--[acetyl-CoA-carboxylase] ligase [Gluconobacter wancherniae]|uniref:biotin--[biotin carboxyl-carrier protein] ligase n=1 Tax=Gluconobacter wancherniae NBRC 103581 TaxID=656744 RepID=A0A511AZ90_9PROT|nr:biotin--[acetyl-CoA-carboxylase] ligase [Gluconobacter wancherniae]MBF0853645.1 biotin--[acetyl-CoA-carboxylase] ligase [Gluconobacter wancherniae]MBS1063133.1 biotin--[acetyl-CoA-carboxylase] ligase [Gluconobacter wancherniae]GBD55610.1 biotin--[acetyl-CoA-carboxylase] ligase [Gluconobacter wancherniae NBRC 103581]GBR66444.1 biotin--acetyl-CoA-carboxylase ligase [Gluconobacter wancherniae NBRC 103581]GEK93488.1 biotin--[acetyl-CoA-carboxylase] ligase [Gluconobacter wancherniae NBRC 103581]